LSQGVSIINKLFLIDLSAADPAARELIMQLLVRNLAMAVLGIVLIAVGVALAMRRRSRDQESKGAG